MQFVWRKREAEFFETKNNPFSLSILWTFSFCALRFCCSRTSSSFILQVFFKASKQEFLESLLHSHHGNAAVLSEQIIEKYEEVEDDDEHEKERKRKENKRKK